MSGRHVEGVGRVLKVAALYGPNASGKSNLLDALSLVSKLVHDGVDVDAAIPVTPFKLDRAYLSRPTQIELQFVADEVVWRYAISVTSQRVESERLDRMVGGDLAMVFERRASEGKRPDIAWEDVDVP